MFMFDLSGQTILVMRALWEQVPLISRAQELGARTVVIDEREDAEGFSHADEDIVVNSLRDVNECLDVAREFQVDALTADECDYSLFTIAFLGESLSLPSPTLTTAQTTTNKGRLRHRLLDEVEQPSFSVCSTLTEVREAAAEIGFPAIVKPVDNRGAFGVSRVSDHSELREAYLAALANSHAREVIVEEFIDGTPITVEGYYFDGAHQTLLVGSKDTRLGNLEPNREIYYPARISDDQSAGVKKMNNSIAAAVGGSYGATHAEYIVTENNILPIEFHNRGGGIHISAKVVPALTGFDVSTQLLADACEVGFSQEFETGDCDESIVIHPLELPTGHIKQLHGRAKVTQRPDVLTFQPYFELGDQLTAVESPVDSHGVLITRGETIEAAKSSITKVYDELEPIYID